MKKSKAFQAVKQVVGIDISKDDMNVCFQQLSMTQKRRIKGSRKVKNTKAGFKQLEKWIARKRDPKIPVHIVMEATGVYYEDLVYFLKDNTIYIEQQPQYLLHVLLPTKAKSYIKSLNIKTKTDKIDAKYISQMGLEQELEVWQAPSEQARILKQLSRERTRLVEFKTQVINQLHAMNHAHLTLPMAIQMAEEQLTLLKKQVVKVEKAMTVAVKKDKKLAQKVKDIRAIPGVGLVTTICILGETNCFQFFSSRAQLTSYAGLDVVERQSGSSLKGRSRISKRGNHHIRRALHFPALTTVRLETAPFKELYDRVVERTGIKMKGAVAVQRKLLLLMYTLYTKDKKYDPNYAAVTAEVGEKEDSVTIVPISARIPIAAS